MTKTKSWSVLGLFTAVVVFLVLVGFLPDTNSVFWPAKSTLLLLLIPVGLPLLVRMAITPQATQRHLTVPARFALVFMAIAGLSTVFANTRTTAIYGLYLWGNGLIFVASLVSAWAIGVSLNQQGRRLVTFALIAGIAANVVVAVLQMLMDLSSLDLVRYDGRSPGIQGNPVHLGALMAAGVALALPWQGRRLLPWLGLIYAMAAALQVSGSRSALLAMVVVLVAGFFASRRQTIGQSAWKLSVQRGLMVVLAVILGLTAGAGLSKWGGGASVSERLTAAEGGGGVGARVSMWWATRHAVGDHPLIGSGPGTYREATSRYRTISVARAFGADLYFTDAHNILVEYATTTGLFGVGALLAWLAITWRRSRGPLKFFALALFLAGLTEPQSAGTTPLLFLGLGMAILQPGIGEQGANASAELHPRSPKLVVACTAILFFPAFVAGWRFIDGELHFEKASHGLSRSDSQAALDLFPQWSYPAIVRSIVEDVRGPSDNSDEKDREVRHWIEEAIRRDPTDHALWLHLGDFLIKRQDYDGAGRAYRNALVHNPVSTMAAIHLAELANGAGDVDSAIKWLERALSVVPDQPNIQKALRELKRQENLKRQEKRETPP